MKAEAEAKYWLNADIYDIEEEFSFNMTPSQEREVHKLIFTNFDYIISQWNEFQKQKK
jgi:hypothetical protein